MLFRPHREWRIWGRRVPFTPGLVPREQARLGRKLGEAIEKHLLTDEVLTQTLAENARNALQNEIFIDAGKDAAKKAADTLLPQISGFVADLHTRLPLLDDKLATLTRHIADESIGTLASVFVKKDKIYPGIKTWLVDYFAQDTNHDEIRARLHEAIDHADAATFAQAIPQEYALERILPAVAAQVAKHIPIADMVEKKMATYDVAEAEKMILSVVGRELKIIVMLGGVFGFLIGMLSLIPMMMG